jgi:hypothetical protein
MSCELTESHSCFGSLQYTPSSSAADLAQACHTTRLFFLKKKRPPSRVVFVWCDTDKQWSKTDGILHPIPPACARSKLNRADELSRANATRPPTAVDQHRGKVWCHEHGPRYTCDRRRSRNIVSALRFNSSISRVQPWSVQLR